MICSRTDLLRVVCLAGVLIGGAAAAQDLPPLQPQGDAIGATPAYSPVEVPDRGSGIEVGVLEKLPLGGVGLLRPGDGGLPDDLWKNSRADMATMRLLALPDRAASRALQDLERRLLLTAAPPPESADDAADLDFLAARLDRLAAMGDLRDMTALFGRMGRDFHHPRLNHMAIAVSLLNGREAEACALAASVPPPAPSPDWLRLAAFCRAFGGDSAGAALGLEMLAEQKGRAPAYDKLMAALLKQQAAGGAEADKPGPKLKSMKGATPLLLSLARLVNAPLAADVIDGASPLLLAALAQNPALDIKLRLLAAETVARTGGFALDQLTPLYDAAPLSPAALADPLGSLQKPAADDPVLFHALAYRAAEAAPTDSARLAIVLAGLERARAAHEPGFYASVMAPFLDRVAPSADSLPVADEIVRLFLLAGHVDSARQWYGVLQRQAAVGNSEARLQADGLWPLMVILAAGDARADPVWSPEALAGWIATREQLPIDQRNRQVALVAVLLAQAGYPVPPDLLPPPDAANPEGFGPGQDLLILAGEKRTGEAVLEGLKLAGHGLDKLTPQTVAVLMDGLTAVDLGPEARLIVTEALIAQGL